jgi:phage terminase large subunit-like protein
MEFLEWFMPTVWFVILALFLFACGIPGWGLAQMLPPAVMMPHHDARITPGWKDAHITELVPKQMLADASRRGSPLEWGTAAVGEYRLRQADRIVGEVNNGGDLVEANLRSVDPHVAYEAVRASRGKLVRAEPVAALYERGMVHHVGHFPAMETELTTYSGKPSEDSPNRLDALVWAISSLGGTPVYGLAVD